MKTFDTLSPFNPSAVIQNCMGKLTGIANKRKVRDTKNSSQSVSQSDTHARSDCQI